jgi:protein-S-isoprenylcysteine O-methyltransferase Ste14
MRTALRSLGKILVGLTIFVGLPFFAWGITDVSGFLQSPARLGYVALVLLVHLVEVTAMPDAGSGRTGLKTVKRQRLALLFLQMIPLAIVVAAPFGDRRDHATFSDSNLLRFSGLALFAAGMGLMLWAEAALGRFFSVQVTIQEGHKLVVDGPYRLIRHPRYLGIIVFAIGLSLTFRSWLGLVLVGGLMIVLWWRIHDEEKLMHQEFGADWEAYCRVTWRLVPFVY